MKKNLIVLITGLIFFTSCKKDKASTAVLNETTDTTTAAKKLMGTFMNGPYGTVMGGVQVYEENNTFTLQLQNVTISNGPDLHVYISKEEQPVNFIDLGKLKSTMGNQVYNIPGKPDFTQYKFALIHCQQYNHLFGSASLQ
jgi:Electron transfer DM13